MEPLDPLKMAVESLKKAAEPLKKATAILPSAFGTAVKSDRRFPEKYGVLGDYMPEGLLKQQVFPFTWKG